MNKLYEEKELGYYSNLREELLHFVPKNSNNVLEIGAASGDNLVYLKKNGIAKHVFGLELFKIDNSNQDSNLIDEFYIQDIESNIWGVDGKEFDVIICGDVLEHLVDPWKVVKKIKGLLSERGLLILSIPNIRNYKAFIKIFIKGDFGYEKEGLFDKTHLRFFCKKNLLTMLNEFHIEKVTSTDFWEKSKYVKKKLLNIISLGLFKDLLVTQYIIIARKKTD